MIKIIQFQLSKHTNESTTTTTKTFIRHMAASGWIRGIKNANIETTFNRLLSIAALNAGSQKHSEMTKHKTRWYKTHRKDIWTI